MSIKDLSRRDFMRLSALASAGLALPGGAKLLYAQQDLVKKNIQETTMSYIPFGKTKMLVSRLALGSSVWDNNVAQVALEAGVNFVHTSIDYGRGNNILEIAKSYKGKMDKIFVAIKHNPDEENINTALKALAVDHVDMVMPVFGSPPSQAQCDKLKEDFDKVKAAGKVRFLGFTVHGRAPFGPVIDAAVKTGYFSGFITMYQPENVAEMKPALDRARKAGVGTISMKTLQGIGPPRRGRGQQQQQQETKTAEEYRAAQCKAIESALTKDGGIDMVSKGIVNVTDLQAFVPVAKKMKPDWIGQALSPEEFKELVDTSVCGACAACAQACPQGIDTPEIMRCRTYYDLRIEDCAQQHYLAIPHAQTAAACQDCAACEAACPRDLPIREEIRRAAKTWG